MTWRDEELKKQRWSEDRLLHYLGDLAATRFCMDLVFIAHLWDDLIDKDKDRTPAEIGDAFRVGLVEIQANPFLVRFPELRPLMLSAMLKYEALLPLEQGSGHDKAIAFTLRNGLLDVMAYSMYLLRGITVYRHEAPRFYQEMWSCLEDQFQAFMKENSDA